MNTGDARRASRRRTLLGAKIMFSDKETVFDCTLRNLSEGGAKLQIESIVGISRNFHIQIPSLDERHQCVVVWNSMNELGIRFARKQTTLGHPHLQLVQ